MKNKMYSVIYRKVGTYFAREIYVFAKNKHDAIQKAIEQIGEGYEFAEPLECEE